uniref:Uncharacterized protein n=1 Tax=Anopheles coluzzii TaxID=1518534 RepID=A0A8W7PEK9_ANOCL
MQSRWMVLVGSTASTPDGSYAADPTPTLMRIDGRHLRCPQPVGAEDLRLAEQLVQAQITAPCLERVSVGQIPAECLQGTQQQMGRDVIDDAPLVQRLELELAVLVLLVLVHRAERPDPVAPDALDLAQPVPAERSDLAREAHLRHLPELVQLRAFVDLLAFLVLAVGVFGRVGKRRHVAAILIVLPCMVNSPEGTGSDNDNGVQQRASPDGTRTNAEQRVQMQMMQVCKARWMHTYRLTFVGIATNTLTATVTGPLRPAERTGRFARLALHPDLAPATPARLMLVTATSGSTVLGKLDRFQAVRTLVKNLFSKKFLTKK